MAEMTMQWCVVSVLAALLICLSLPAGSEGQSGLRKGKAFRLTVDAGKVVRAANRRLLGISFHTPTLSDPGYAPFYDAVTGEWVLKEHIVRAIRALRLPLSRMYWLDPATSRRPVPWDLEGTIDRLAEICDRLGIEQESFIIELEQQAHGRSTSPERWAQAVRYSQGKGYRFRLWEVCNEPYLTGGPHSDPWTAEDYVAHVKEVYRAIKAVDAEAQVGSHGGLSPWNLLGATQTEDPIISELAGYYDFICPHFYCHMPDVDLVPFEHISFDGNQWLFDAYIRPTRVLIDRYNPGKHIPMLDTEWGMHGYPSNPSGDPELDRADYANRDCNIAGALHRAIRLIYYFNEDMLQGAGQWTMLEPAASRGWSIVASDDERLFILYYFNLYFGQYLGDQVVSFSGTCPYYEKTGVDFGYGTEGTRDISMPKVPVLATKSADGKTLYLIAANGTAAESIPCHVDLEGFLAVSAEGKRLSQEDSADALVDRESDVMSALAVKVLADGGSIEFDAAAHSVSFIALRAGAM